MFKFALLAVLFASAYAVVPEDPDNVYIEKSVSVSRQLIDSSMKLHDVKNREVEYSPTFFMTLRGKVNLTDGILNDIFTYKLDGTIKRLRPGRFDVPIVFSTVDFGFNYESDLVLFFDNHGKVDGIVRNYKLILPIEVRDGKYELSKDPETHIPNLDINFENGNTIITAVYNLVSPIFKKIVIQLNNEEYAHMLAIEVIKAMNKAAENQ